MTPDALRERARDLVVTWAVEYFGWSEADARFHLASDNPDDADDLAWRVAAFAASVAPTPPPHCQTCGEPHGGECPYPVAPPVDTAGREKVIAAIGEILDEAWGEGEEVNTEAQPLRNLAEPVADWMLAHISALRNALSRTAPPVDTAGLRAALDAALEWIEGDDEHAECLSDECSEARRRRQIIKQARAALAPPTPKEDRP
jgi:hypothetical protein